jgi:F0F1-type ATP synthase delta subunit
MESKYIKKLAIASYSKEKLDLNRVNKITKYLSRSDLKEYIRHLKNLEKQKTVYVYLSKINKQNKNEFDKMFKDKKVILLEDKSLIAGFKILDNDNVYEQNIQNNIKNIINYIGQ